MKFTKKGKLLAVLLAVLMVATMLPASVLADTGAKAQHSHTWKAIGTYHDRIVAKTADQNQGLVNHSESDNILTSGDTWHFTAEPKTGYEFVNWTFSHPELVKINTGSTNQTLEIEYKYSLDIGLKIAAGGKFTATAHFKARTQYTVTFKDWDGDVLKTETVYSGDDATPPADPTRTGHTFTGWDGDYEDVTENRTITATYEPLYYAVAYDANGGTGTYSGGTPPANYAYGAQITVPNAGTLSKTGHTFGGWNTKADGTGTDYAEGDKFNLEGPVTLYAQYTINQYTVTFVDWDGSVLDTDTVDHGGDATPPADPSRTGHTFTGWDGDYEDVTENRTIQATYTINTYIVTFIDYNGKELKRQPVNHGDDATPPEDPVRTGHTFADWFGNYEDVTENRTIQATYTINTYTLAYDANGGTGSPSGGTAAGTYDYNTAITAAAAGTLSKTGHTFSGWNTEADGTGTDYAEGETFNLEGNVTLYAKWTINVYKVRFIDWDDSLIVERDVPHGSNATPPDDPERPGYTFTGWLPVGSQISIYSANNSIRGMSTTVMSNPYDNVTGPLTLQAQYTADDQILVVGHIIYKDREQTEILTSMGLSYNLPTDVVITVADYAIVPHPGYDMSTAPVTYTMAPGLVNFVYIYYTPQEQGYTVHYYLEGTTDPVAPDKTGTGVTMQSITESPVEIEGYEPVSADDVTIQLTADPAENIITFFYTEVEEIVETQPPLGPVSPEPTETPEPTESLEPVETVPEETSPAAPALPVTGENPLDWVLMVGALVVATGAVLLFTRRKKQREE